MKSTTVEGVISIPSSKSHTIRALLIASFAQGRSIIHRALDSLDTRSCIALCRSLGVDIKERVEQDFSLTLTVDSFGPPMQGSYLDCGNSGTTLYFATALVATYPHRFTFTGDEQLRSRPVSQLLLALESLGASVTYLEKEGYPPFTIQGPLTGGEVEIECQTSQFLSSLLLATPLAQKESSIKVTLLNEKPYVDMTLKWLNEQKVSYKTDSAYSHFLIEGNHSYIPLETTIGGDFSSASFFFCAAAITKGVVTVTNLDRFDTQGDKALLDILSKMGAVITWEDNHTVTVEGKELKGGVFNLNDLPDALPVLAVTACYARGITTFTSVAQARIKETDRISVMRENLQNCGAHIEEREDGLVIHGKGSLEGGVALGYGDHRIIMAMAIASLASTKSITIKGVDAVNVTFPTFFTLLDQISLSKREESL